MSTTTEVQPCCVEHVQLPALGPLESAVPSGEVSEPHYGKATLDFPAQDKNSLVGRSIARARSSSTDTSGASSTIRQVCESNESLEVDSSTIAQAPGAAEALGTAQAPSTALFAEVRTVADDRRQLPLNISMVILTICATVSVLYALRVQLADHRINKLNLDLGLWSAWMDFRQACNASVGDAGDARPDCKTVLKEPLRKPPMPINAPGQRRSLSSIVGIISGRSLKQQLLIPIDDIAGMAIVRMIIGFAVIFLIAALIYLLTTSSGRQLRTRRIYESQPTTEAWVSVTLPRELIILGPAYTSSSEKNPRNPHRRLGKLYIHNWTPEWPHDLPGLVSALLDIVVQWFYSGLSDDVNTNDDQNSTSDINSEKSEELESESEWVPIATGLEDDTSSEVGSLLALPNFAAVKLILNELFNLGYRGVTFDRLERDESIAAYFSKDPGLLHNFFQYSDISYYIEGRDIRDPLLPPPSTSDLAKGSWWATWCIKLPNLALKDLKIAQLNFHYVDKEWHLWQPNVEVRDRMRKPCVYILDVGLCKDKYHVIFQDVSASQFEKLVQALGEHTPSEVAQIELPDMRSGNGNPSRIALDSLFLQIQKYSDEPNFVPGEGVCERVLVSHMHPIFGDGARYQRTKNGDSVGWLVRSNSKPIKGWLAELQAESRIFEWFELRRLDECSKFLVDKYGRDAEDLMKRWRRSLCSGNAEYCSQLADVVLLSAGVLDHHRGHLHPLPDEKLWRKGADQCKLNFPRHFLIQGGHLADEKLLSIVEAGVIHLETSSIFADTG